MSGRDVAGLNGLLPEFRPYAEALVSAAGSAGLLPRITSVRRTRSQQARLYQRAQAGLSQYPAAPPGTSAHEYGFAFDMIVTPLEALADVGEYWRSMGGLYYSSDAVHFEFPGFKQYLEDTQPGLVETVFQAWSDLPWYLSVFTPLASTVQDTKQTSSNQAIQKVLSKTGWF